VLRSLTGATGFVGSHIAEALVAKGHSVRALVRKSSDVRRLLGLGVELLCGDLGSEKDLRRLASGAAAVVHNGYSHDRDELPDPVGFYTVNTLGSIGLLELCRRTGVGQFIFISSCSAYGKPLYEPVDENHVCRPSGGYAAYKAAVDAYVYAYRREFGCRATSLRLGWVYGPREPAEKMLWRDLAERVCAGGEVKVSGHGQMVHASDCAGAVLAALERPELCAGEIYNVIEPEPTDWFDVAGMIKELGRCDARLSREPGEAPVRFSNAKALSLGCSFRGPAGVREHVEHLVRTLRERA
jgi:UDP-glucose 4-epimerase